VAAPLGANKSCYPHAELDASFRKIELLVARGRRVQAEAACRKFVSEQPGHPGAAHLLGVLLVMKGERGDGTRWLKLATRAEPDNYHYWKDLGLAMAAGNSWKIAVHALRRSFILRPADPEVTRYLGECLCRMGDYEEALAVFESVPDADMGLCAEIARLRTWRLDAAIGGLRRFIASHPNGAEARLHLTSALFAIGDISGAIDSAAAADHIAPQRAVASFLCRMLQYAPGTGRARIAAEHRRFGDAHCPVGDAPKRSYWPRTGDRLRIGYVSSLFRQHSNHLGPILRWHDRRRFEIFCFSDRGPFDVTGGRTLHEQIDTRSMSDADLARSVRKRKIDILVECDGHSNGGTRLPVFASRAAPMQFALALYPGTTGTRNIDFRITDAVVDPPGTEEFFTERLTRIGVFLCCDPGAARRPPSPLPAIRNGYVTFGSSSIPAKINEDVARLWAAILRAVPSSRLVLHHIFSPRGAGAINPTIRKRLLGIFADCGIPARRVELIGELSAEEHLRVYDRIDIALDPFPWNGVRTTFDALLRGVPVVALAGNTSAGRTAMSLLSTAGFARFVGADPRGYKRIAVDLAANPAMLAILRGELGARTKVSLCNGRRWVAELEDAYLGNWQSS